MKTQHDNMEEAQLRIVELEEWQTEAKREILTMAALIQRIQEKMTDLEEGYAFLAYRRAWRRIRQTSTWNAS